MQNGMIEPLEPRALLSGDVTAEVINGSLILRGDDAANVITIDRDPLTGAVRVLGNFGTDNRGQVLPEHTTTVNGQPSVVHPERPFLSFDNVTRDVRVELGGGDDKLVVNGLDLPRRLRVDAGAGADRVEVIACRVGAGLFIRGVGGGDKTVAVSASDVAGPTRVLTGADADAVSLTASTFNRRTVVRTGRGDDEIVTSADFRRGMARRDGPGQDSLLEGTTVSFDFRNGEQGWVGEFTDYDPGYSYDLDGQPIMTTEESMELQAGLRPLPAELGVDGTGFMLSGINTSDDLTMFIKRRLGREDGVLPGQVYRLEFAITFASDAPTGTIGIGGPPGEAVSLHAGGIWYEPQKVRASNGGSYRMNVDAEPEGRSAASTRVGNIANGVLQGKGKVPYVSLARRHVHRFNVTAGADGNLWLLVDTKSGYESRTTLYYENISVTLIPLSPSMPQVDAPMTVAEMEPN